MHFHQSVRTLALLQLQGPQPINTFIDFKLSRHSEGQTANAWKAISHTLISKQKKTSILALQIFVRCLHACCGMQQCCAMFNWFAVICNAIWILDDTLFLCPSKKAKLKQPTQNIRWLSYDLRIQFCCKGEVYPYSCWTQEFSLRVLHISVLTRERILQAASNPAFPLSSIASIPVPAVQAGKWIDTHMCHSLVDWAER